MHLHHVAIRAQDPEALKVFNSPLFGGQTNEHNHMELIHSPSDWPRC
ncbi:hypothetical protein [Aeromonas media]|nr:hypothetical protein [Aeromonas media]